MKELLLILASMADIWLTYSYVKRLKKTYPKRDVYRNELNGVIVILWKKFGLKRGTLIAAAYTITMFTALIIFMDEWFFYFMSGVFTVVLWVHYSNWYYWKYERGKKK